MTLRVNNREWNLPIDAPLHYAVTRVHVLETGDSPIDPSQINVTVARNVNPIGPYHDTSDYFDLFRLKSSNLRNGIQFEVYLSKSLMEPEGKFQAGDQFTLEIRAKDRRASHVVKNEIYGRIEEARMSPLTPSLPPPPSSTTATTTSTAASVETTEDKNATTTATAEKSSSETNVYLIILPILTVGLSLTVAWCFKGKLVECWGRLCRKKSTNKTDVDAVKSNMTEISELPSRKISSASNAFSESFQSSSNPYEDSLIINNTKEEKDRWEFPRHHLKFYGILGRNNSLTTHNSIHYSLLFPGEGCFGQVWKCEALNIEGTKGTTTVAVKTLKASATQKERDDLIKELNVMKMFYDDPHPNVVRLMGCCTAGSDKGRKYF